MTKWAVVAVVVNIWALLINVGIVVWWAVAPWGFFPFINAICAVWCGWSVRSMWRRVGQ